MFYLWFGECCVSESKGSIPREVTSQQCSSQSWFATSVFDFVESNLKSCDSSPQPWESWPLSLPVRWGDRQKGIGEDKRMNLHLPFVRPCWDTTADTLNVRGFTAVPSNSRRGVFPEEFVQVQHNISLFHSGIRLRWSETDNHCGVAHLWPLTAMSHLLPSIYFTTRWQQGARQANSMSVPWCRSHTGGKRSCRDDLHLHPEVTWF